MKKLLLFLGLILGTLVMTNSCTDHEDILFRTVSLYPHVSDELTLGDTLRLDSVFNVSSTLPSPVGSYWVFNGDSVIESSGVYTHTKGYFKINGDSLQKTDESGIVLSGNFRSCFFINKYKDTISSEIFDRILLDGYDNSSTPYTKVKYWFTK